MYPFRHNFTTSRQNYTNSTSGLFFLALVLLFLFSGCEKITDPDPDKLPAKLKFDFSMTDFELSGDKDLQNGQTEMIKVSNQTAYNPDAGRPDRFVLDSGTMVIENIEFEGRRIQGQEHIYFKTDFSSAFEVDLSDPAAQPDISFDIPQGNYYLIEIILHLGTDNLSSLVMQGNYTHPAHGDIPVIYDYSPREQIRIRAKLRGDQNSFALAKEKDSQGRIELDTDSLMRLVNYGMIVNALVADANGEEVFLINETINPGLFNNISTRLPNAFTLVIE
ncbi:MAG: hypothetical protein ACLFN2_01735 [Bacteroidales bacterium]